MNGSKNRKCCCGPYPIIDLSCAFNSIESSSGALKEINKLKTEVRRACSQYGCFHVKIKESDIRGGEKLSDENAAKEAIDDLFDESFLSTSISSASGGNVETVRFQDTDGNIISAKYRAREAESGGSSGLEPKQSWEYFRCRNMLNPTDSKEGLRDTIGRLEILSDYTRILHQVAICLFSNILDFPKGMFVDERRCGCDKQKGSCYCSIDLLRAFKYDALIDGHEANLGSSPHTDWGALTVVWQDSKGGLQMYCHEHGRWSDVKVEKDEDGYVRLFLHVGDFTSLANCTAASNPPKTITWPSPLHRVLCPKKTHDSSEDGRFDARHSLVYFVYPPKGISLEDAALSLSRSHRLDLDHREENQTTDKQFPYHRFMVLKNQSMGALHNSEQQVYTRIAKADFDKVIEEKWNQVQR